MAKRPAPIPGTKYKEEKQKREARTEAGLLKQKEEQDKRREIAQKLNTIIDQDPNNHDLLQWAYVELTDEELSSKDSFEGYELFKLRYQADYDIFEELLEMLFDGQDFDNPHLYNEWNTELEQYVIKQELGIIVNDVYPYKLSIGEYDGGTRNATWDKWSDKRALFQDHVKRYKRVTLAQSLDIDDVYANIKRMEDGHSPSSTKQKTNHKYDTENLAQKLLSLPIPESSDKEIAAKIEALDPKSRDDLSGFGEEYQIQMAKALQEISDYFIHHAARPYKVLERIQKINEALEESGVRGKALIPSMPQTALARMSGRVFGVSLVSPEKMPFAQEIALAKDLPDLAEEDKERYSTDLQILDHAIKLCEGYFTVLKRHHAAFKNFAATQDANNVLSAAEKETEDELGFTFARVSHERLFDARLDAIKGSMLVLNHAAGNFASIADGIALNRNELGQVANLSYALQKPALDAVRQFNLYQYQRLRAFRVTVTDKVREQLELNDDMVAGQNTLSPAILETHLLEAHQALATNFGQYFDKVSEKVVQNAATAQDIQDTLQDNLMGTLDPSEVVTSDNEKGRANNAGPLQKVAMN